MEGRIFINYRRAISAAAAGRLSDRLIQHFDREQLFMDVDGVEPGVDFIKALDDQVAQCSAFIAVIGPGWTDLKDGEAGLRRLDQPNDHVRIEIESALKRDIRVIPVLVDGADMPTSQELPDSLKPLLRRQAVSLSHQRFGAEVDELARALQRALGLPSRRNTATDAFATRQTAAPSWINYLFSFEGRVSRSSYWRFVFAVVLIYFVVYAVLAAVTGETNASSRKLLILLSIATIPLYWPSWAILLKRLHDFGEGRLWLWLLVIVSMLGTWLPVVAGPIVGGPAYGLAAAAVIISWASVIFIGCIEGTSGPNQYGPDPSLDRKT